MAQRSGQDDDVAEIWNDEVNNNEACPSNIHLAIQPLIGSLTVTDCSNPNVQQREEGNNLVQDDIEVPHDEVVSLQTTLARVVEQPRLGESACASKSVERFNADSRANDGSDLGIKRFDTSQAGDESSGGVRQRDIGSEAVDFDSVGVQLGVPVECEYVNDRAFLSRFGQNLGPMRHADRSVFNTAGINLEVVLGSDVGPSFGGEIVRPNAISSDGMTCSARYSARMKELRHQEGNDTNLIEKSGMGLRKKRLIATQGRGATIPREAQDGGDKEDSLAWFSQARMEGLDTGAVSENRERRSRKRGRPKKRVVFAAAARAT
ncbi:hypothetical protein Dimus_003678 [Dionaea muscipula]